MWASLRSNINDRFEGYQQALKDNGLPFAAALVAKGDRSFEGGAIATAELIQRQIRFDSVFASNDIMAMGCIEKLLDSGFGVPQDISLIGYDDIPMAKFFRPHLSTVHSPVRELGVEAVKTLLRIIYSKKGNMGEKVFQAELVARQTTKYRPII